jgi:hypothetical protein
MELADLEQYLLRVAAKVPRAKLAAQEEGDSEQQVVAAEMLRDQHTTATGCYRAVGVVCGPSFRAWEPESIWLTLERKGIDVSVLNRDKIMAASTLTMIPAFWFEVNAFENTVMAFNNVLSDGEVLQEATPAQINWAVYEAEMLYGQADDVPEAPAFDREPMRYTAVVLHRAGFIVTPQLLSFAQKELDALSRNGAGANKAEVQDAWKRLQRVDLRKRPFSDSALDVQLGRLAAVQVYMLDRLVQYESDISRLRL